MTTCGSRLACFSLSTGEDFSASLWPLLSGCSGFFSSDGVAFHLVVNSHKVLASPLRPLNCMIAVLPGESAGEAGSRLESRQRLQQRLADARRGEVARQPFGRRDNVVVPQVALQLGDLLGR